MKYTLVIITVFIFAVLFLNCKAQSQAQQIINYNSLIIGTWISEDDPDYKIEFTSQGIQKEYVNNELQEEIYQYSIIPSCGSNSNNGFDVFLKRQTNIIDYTCDIINNIHTDSNGIITLSITTESGQLDRYIKQ
ncbi:hypothetical protein [uncultured Winogradskyella sp.]|uniref:hypothetical protein n=1 Tax=uncultured Winogradskyella sp. TaxID=395353 RepID=UPI0026155763|nr:hypothetical protein [uncultured Winogradskyella sp.]